MTETRSLPFFQDARHINSQFHPDGQSLYFIADLDGYSNVYWFDFDDEQLFQLTNLATGVSGITALALALSVAQQAGRMGNRISLERPDGRSHGWGDRAGQWYV